MRCQPAVGGAAAALLWVPWATACRCTRSSCCNFLSLWRFQKSAASFSMRMVAQRMVHVQVRPVFTALSISCFVLLCLRDARIVPCLWLHVHRTFRYTSSRPVVRRLGVLNPAGHAQILHELHRHAAGLCAYASYLSDQPDQLACCALWLICAIQHG
jgi:hypothetical protein